MNIIFCVLFLTTVATATEKVSSFEIMFLDDKSSSLDPMYFFCFLASSVSFFVCLLLAFPFFGCFARFSNFVEYCFLGFPLQFTLGFHKAP